MEVKQLDGWTFTLYGYRNHKCLRITDDECWHPKTYFTAVSDSFVLEDVVYYHPKYGGRDDGDLHELELLNSKKETVLTFRTYSDNNYLAWEEPRLYNLIDDLVDIGDDLGITSPKFVEEDSEWAGWCRETKETKVPFDQVSEYLDIFEAVVLGNRRKLDSLKGKDIFELVNELDETKNREKILRNELETLKKEREEERNRLESTIKTLRDQAVAATSSYTTVLNERNALQKEQADFKTKIKDALLKTLNSV